MLRTIAILFLTFLSISNTAHAQVTTSLRDYFNESKGYSNTTDAGHYEGQSMGVYTFGNYVKRSPQKSANIASIQLPSVKAGCGGIDAFSGGFSYISGEAIGDLLTAIMQNAEGFAFMLAIDVVDAQIGSELSKLQSWAQKMNSINIQSCDAAAAAVGSIAAQIPIARDHACQRLGSSRGIFSDFAASRNGCQNRTQEVLGGSTPQEKKQLPVNRNYGFEATEGNSLYSSKEMREFLMSISGSIVIRQDEAGETKFNYIEPISLDERAVSIIMNGGNLKIHKCNDDACLNVTRLGKPVNITANDAFTPKVSSMLSSIYQKESGQSTDPITAQEKAFIEQTSLPILKAIKVYAAHAPGQRGEAAVLSYSELIAYEMVLQFLEEQARAVEAGSQNVVGGERETYQMWRQSLQDNRRAIREQQERIDVRFSATMQFIDHIGSLEQSNAARLINSLTEEGN